MVCLTYGHAPECLLQFKLAYFHSLSSLVPVSELTCFAIPKPSKLISKLCKGYLRYVEYMLMFRSIRRIKLSTFTHQFTYNSLESVVEFEIEQGLICAKDTHIYTRSQV